MTAISDYRGAERRKHKRVTSLKAGRVIVNSRSISSCLVLDISDGGACIQLSSNTEVPERFSLEIGRERARGCRVRWRRENKIGVEFL